MFCVGAIFNMAGEMLDWSIDRGYIYNDFVVNSFLIWHLTFFDFCLRNFKFDVSSREFVWEDGEVIVGIPHS